MLKNIKSIYFIKNLFLFVHDKQNMKENMDQNKQKRNVRHFLDKTFH